MSILSQQLQLQGMLANEGYCQGLLLFPGGVHSVCCVCFPVILLVLHLISLFWLQPAEKMIKKAAKIRYCCYILQLLLPWLRDLRQEQLVEIEIEAKIRGMTINFIKLLHFFVYVFVMLLKFVLRPGVVSSDIKVRVSECEQDERIYW